MDFTAKSIRKARETYLMYELGTMFPYGLNDRIGNELSTDNNHISVAAKILSLPRNIVVLIVGKITKVLPFFYHNNF